MHISTFFQIMKPYFYSESFYELCNPNDHYSLVPKMILIFVSFGLQTGTTMSPIITGILLPYLKTDTILYKVLNGFIIFSY